MKRAPAQLRVLFLLPILLLGQLALAPMASAGFFLSGDMTMQIGQLPSLSAPGVLGRVTLVNNLLEHDLQIASTAWDANGVAAGTSFFTGYPVLTNLHMTVANQAASLTAYFPGTPNPVGGLLTPLTATICPAGCLGGTLPLSGQIVLDVSGFGLPIPLSVVGVGGAITVTWPGAPGLSLKMTGGPVVTGSVFITDIQTNVISLPARALGVTGVALTMVPTRNEWIVLKTPLLGNITTYPSQPILTRTRVTLKGTNTLLSAGLGGNVTLVTPMRIHATGLPFLRTGEPISPLAAALAALDGTAGAVYLKLHFVPEPTSLMLLSPGAILLALMAVRRRRR